MSFAMKLIQDNFKFRTKYRSVKDADFANLHGFEKQGDSYIYQTNRHINTQTKKHEFQRNKKNTLKMKK